jgi:peroxiredoxin
MNPNPEIAATVPPAVPRMGLAIASLVLGILACMLSLFLVGAVAGLVGLILGLVHVMQKRGSNAMAWWGMGLSVFSILASVAMGAVYYHLVMQIRNQAASSLGADSFAKWEGFLAPDISVTTLDGKTIQLDQLKGKRVVLDFWATWCGPCVREIPHLNRLYNETSRDDLMIIGISDENEATLKSFVAGKGVNYPVASEKNLPSPYKDVHLIPTTFFIDRNGVIRSVVVGYHEFNQLKEHALAKDFEGEPK